MCPQDRFVSHSMILIIVFPRFFTRFISFALLCNFMTLIFCLSIYLCLCICVSVCVCVCLSTVCVCLVQELTVAHWGYLRMETYHSVGEHESVQWPPTVVFHLTN